jgi:ABC-type uncharacterized transport system fused permease/ATPase subunit
MSAFFDKLKALVTLKSKTANLTALAAALITTLKHFGVDVPQEVVVGGFTILAFVLRMVTSKALEDK